MHASVKAWVSEQLPLISGMKVIELGSYNVNGTVRDCVATLKPSAYIGVDIRNGPGVDLVADVSSGIDLPGDFDLVISTETLEHVQSWTLFIREMKRLTKQGGHLLLTCRSPGFELHDYPGDYWRFTKEQIAEVFSEFKIIDLRDDPEAPGVFLHAIREQ